MPVILHGTRPHLTGRTLSAAVWNPPARSFNCGQRVSSLVYGATTRNAEVLSSGRRPRLVPGCFLVKPSQNFSSTRSLSLPASSMLERSGRSPLWPATSVRTFMIGPTSTPTGAMKSCSAFLAASEKRRMWAWASAATVSGFVLSLYAKWASRVGLEDVGSSRVAEDIQAGSRFEHNYLSYSRLSDSGCVGTRSGRGFRRDVRYAVIGLRKEISPWRL